MKGEKLEFFEAALGELRDTGLGLAGTCLSCRQPTLLLKIYGPNDFEPSCPHCTREQILDSIRQKLAARQPKARKTSAPRAAAKAEPAEPAEPAEDEPEAALAPRFPLLSLAELAALPPPRYQVEGLFQERAIIEPFGQTSDGKSITLLDLALSMAKPCASWMDRRILMPGAVVWINADGGRGLIPRVNAWREANPGPFQYPFLTLMGSVHLKRAEEVGPFLRQLKEMKPHPVFIVFDTLSRCIPGVDENDQGEMTAVMENCHRLKDQLGATICLLHHTDKRGAWERGSSVVKNESDTQIRISMDKVSRIITVHCEKQREGEMFPDFHLSLKPVGGSVIVVKAAGAALRPATVERDDRMNRVRFDIAAHPLTTREAIAARLELPPTSVNRYVGELIEDGAVKEIALPAEGRGRGEQGLRIDLSVNGHSRRVMEDVN